MNITEAIGKMKRLEAGGGTFGIVFITQTPPSTLRKLQHCRLRPAPKSQKNTDAFLYFTDADTGLARQCRKRLIRQVCFEGEWERVES